MNITLRIREIENGVIVSGDDYMNKVSCDELASGELHFPTLESALTALPGIARNTWNAAEKARVTWKQIRQGQSGRGAEDVQAGSGPMPGRDEEPFVRDQPVMGTDAFRPGGSSGVDSETAEAE
jgi:hypothetical protein